LAFVWHAAGGVVSTLTLVPFGIALNGSPWPSGPLWIYLAVVGAAAALTLVATLLSSWFALRPRPVSVI
jgi:putative ABC transport system permease protein